MMKFIKRDLVKIYQEYKNISRVYNLLLSPEIYIGRENEQENDWNRNKLRGENF